MTGFFRVAQRTPIGLVAFFGWLAWFAFTNQAFVARAIATDLQEKQQIEFFETSVRPLLIRHCIDCHGPDESGGRLRLDSKAGWQRGGERGPAIVPGDPSASLLMRAVSHRDPQFVMPPKDTGSRLSEAELEVLAKWIRLGAVDPRQGEKVLTDIELAAKEHWAFTPLRVPEIDVGQHPVDFLLDRKRKEQGIVAAELADLPTLIRRTTFDLHGLPPTPEQRQTTRDGFDRLVQDLLQSPRYAERWARHWLDVARYSDAKDGVLMYGDARIRPFAYTYRDYVIRAFHEDKPFDQFIREQLASDLLGLPSDSPQLSALGFLTLGRLFDRNRHDVIDDQIDVVGRGFLGLTLSCARCHDHKFDPIPTADYYSLYGIFASTYEPYEKPRNGPISEAGKVFEEEFAAKLKEVNEKEKAHYDEALKIVRERTIDYLVAVATTEPDITETAIFFLSLTPDQLRPQVTKRWRQWIAKHSYPDDPVFGPWYDLMREPVLRHDDWLKRGVDQRIVEGLSKSKPSSREEVARAYGEIILQAWKSGATDTDPLASLLLSNDGPVWFPQRDVTSYLARTPGDAFRALVAQLDEIAIKHKSAADRAMVLCDTETPVDPVIFQRGDPSMRGNPVPKRFIEVASPPERPNYDHGSGRLSLANDIASPSNPLTARVLANRVWMHHFGEPLVENPSDFGLQTKQPLHHDLLDFLADSLIRNGWRLKPLHALIMSSKAYQRSSQFFPTSESADRNKDDLANAYYWRGNRRRLDLEQMRDAMLSVTGELDFTMYGRPTSITDDANVRRTIYAFVERQNIPDIFQTFDFANADTSTSRRPLTTVPQQALFALNSQFVLARARALAARVAKDLDEGSDKDKSNQAMNDRKIQSLYAYAFGRSPSDGEFADCRDYLATQSVEQLAQVLLASNEFMFVD